MLAAGLWMIAALVVGGFVLSAAFRDYVQSDFEAMLSQTIDAMIGISEIAPDGRVRFLRPIVDQRFEEPYSGLYWQVSEQGGETFPSRSLWDTQLEPDWSRAAPTQSFSRTVGPDEQVLLVAVRDVTLPGTERVFRYMAAGNVDIILSDIHRFDALVAWSLGGLGLGLIAAIALQVNFGLSPLRRIRTGLAAVRSGRSRRLEGDFPPEVMPLVTEVNELLDHNETIVERARTHAGNLAHALKTPLSVLQNEARGPAPWLGEAVLKQTAVMQRHIDHHLRRARATGGGLGVVTPVAKPLSNIVRVIEKLYRDTGVEIALDVAPGLAVAGSKQDLDEIAGNLLDNACKWARAQVRVSVRSIAGERREMVEILVEDDGPGVPEDQLEELFERGRRLDESVPGSGLGLAISRDVAELNGGRVDLAPSPLGGLAARVLWPAAPRG